MLLATFNINLPGRASLSLSFIPVKFESLQRDQYDHSSGKSVLYSVFILSKQTMRSICLTSGDWKERLYCKFHILAFDSFGLLSFALKYPVVPNLNFGEGLHYKWRSGSQERQEKQTTLQEKRGLAVKRRVSGEVLNYIYKRLVAAHWGSVWVLTWNVSLTGLTFGSS